MSNDSVQPSKEDEALERLLKVGSTPPLSDAAYGRIYSAVESEWQGTVRSRARRRVWGAIAAGVVAIALTGAVWRSMEGAPVAGSVARAEAGALESENRFAWHRALLVASSFHEGETLKARSLALLTLQGGGTLRVAGGTELFVENRNLVVLRRGEMYVDIPPELTGRATFAVSTDVGLIEHVGTQFDVTRVGQSVRVRVREGEVRVSHDWGAQKISAGTELLVSDTGVQGRRDISPTGGEWAWTGAVAPEYEIENRKLIDFLQWAARETGRQLSWADPAARQSAERVELHGSVHGLRVEQALDRVLATTSLHLDLDADRIQISSAQ